MEATAGEKRKERKARYKIKLEGLLANYKNILVVSIDNVGSLQMQRVRIALRGKAIPMMGKNTLIRTIVRDWIERTKQTQWETLLDLIKGNVGLIFVQSDDLAAVRKIVTEFKTPAAAKSGTFAPTDVLVPAGPTGLDPGQTGFFQALQIGTKIVKGCIEIMNDVVLVKKGDKITSSAVALLSKLDIKPFFYGVVVKTVYENGTVYPADVLDISPEVLVTKFMSGVSRLVAISLIAKYPTLLTLPIFLQNAFKKVMSISFALNDYTFKQKDDLIKGVEAAKAAPKKEEAPKKDDKAKGKKEEKVEKVEEPVVVDDGDVGMGSMFD